ncbi:MAG: phosphatidylserine/phosphatidylglycerophosphate/cardiolipin synthase family protein [Gammaproteobacteria bacterium]
MNHTIPARSRTMATRAKTGKPRRRPVQSERIRVYTEGDRLYAAMLAAIRSARHSVELESYIFADDEVGRRFIEALSARARAGVMVRVTLDAVGSLFWGSRAVEKALSRGGVHVHWFHRWSWRAPLRYNRRNHRKLLVVDGKRGFFGGFNIHRQNSRAAYGETRWRDTHLEVQGPLAMDLQTLFDALWRRRQRRSPVTLAAGGNQLITNYSRRGRQFLHMLFTSKFATARQSIHLTTPYFVPDYRTRRGLMRAAQRGVDVRLLVPHKNNERVAQWAAHAAYANLLAAGVHIHEYLPRMLHAKTLVVDGEWCSVGTANLDYRSFFLNYELNLASEDPVLVGTLERQFRQDLTESALVRPRRWAKRSWLLRPLELIGWAGRHWL